MKKYENRGRAICRFVAQWHFVLMISIDRLIRLSRHSLRFSYTTHVIYDIYRRVYRVRSFFASRSLTDTNASFFLGGIFQSVNAEIVIGCITWFFFRLIRLVRHSAVNYFVKMWRVADREKKLLYPPEQRKIIVNVTCIYLRLVNV